jgi:hypothetical protein
LKCSFSWQHKYLDAKYNECRWWLVLFEAPIARTLTNPKMVIFLVGSSSVKQFSFSCFGPQVELVG